MKPAYVIGIDGGGTKTSAQLCDRFGMNLAEVTGGPSNFQIIGTANAALAIVDLIQDCCRVARVGVSELRLVFAGLTGAGRPSDQEAMKSALQIEAVKRRMPRGIFVVESDARIALEGAHGGKPGIIVIAGTGSIVFGKDKLGNVHRSGGWGRIIGDEGGGFTIGKLALRAVARDFDGRDRTRMRSMIATRFSLDSPEAMIRAVYKDALEIATLTPIVLEAAGKRDQPARAILAGQANELAADVAQVARKIKRQGEKVSVAFVGNIAGNKNFFSAELHKRIRAKVKSARIVNATYTPVHGAVLMAIQILNQSR
jgi:N-acetylglucosamine kinase-like BadF-type ATPase